MLLSDELASSPSRACSVFRKDWQDSMLVWVQTVKHGRFPFNVSLDTQVGAFKGTIVATLTSQHFYVPLEHQIASQGRFLSNNTTFRELGTTENDSFFFLYDLDAAPSTPTNSLPTSSAPLQRNPPVHSLELLTSLANKTSNLDGFPFPNEEAIEGLMAMGFSRFLAQKALICSDFDPDAAANWIVENLDLPNLEDPVPLETLRRAFNVLHPEEKKTMEKMIQQCVENNKCTIIATQKNFEKQAWFKCFTCGFVDDQGICESCANVCHAGHNLSEDQSLMYSNGFYCDCGAEPSCKCNIP